MALNLYEKIEFEIVKNYKTKTRYAKTLGMRKQKLNYILNKLKSEKISIDELTKITNSLKLELAILVKRRS